MGKPNTGSTEKSKRNRLTTRDSLIQWAVSFCVLWGHGMQKSTLLRYYKEAQQYFKGESFPTLRFVTDKYEENLYIRNGVGSTAEYVESTNTILIYSYSLKRKDLDDPFWKAVMVHELTHWFFRGKYFEDCHNKAFAKKLLSIYRKMFKDERKVIEILRFEKWFKNSYVGEEDGWPVYEGQLFIAHKVCKSYGIL